MERRDHFGLLLPPHSQEADLLMKMGQRRDTARRVDGGKSLRRRNILAAADLHQHWIQVLIPEGLHPLGNTQRYQIPHHRVPIQLPRSHRLHLLRGDVHAFFSDAGDELRHPRFFALADGAVKFLKHWKRALKPQRHYMELMSSKVHRQLHARDQLHAFCFGRRLRFIEAAHIIVICQRKGPQAPRPRQPRQIRRRIRPIRNRRMCM